jgi:hypothetical protein
MPAARNARWSRPTESSCQPFAASLKSRGSEAVTSSLRSISQGLERMAASPVKRMDRVLARMERRRNAYRPIFCFCRHSAARVAVRYRYELPQIAGRRSCQHRGKCGIGSFGDPNSLHSKVAGAGGVRYQLADGYACIEQDRRGKYSCGGRFHDGSHTRYLRAIANDTSANARPANNRTQKAGAEARAQTQGRCEQDEGPHGSASYSGGATTALWIVPEYDLVGGSRAGHGALTFPWLFSSRGKYPSAWC